MIIQGSLGEHHYSVGSALLPVLDIQKVFFHYLNSISYTHPEGSELQKKFLNLQKFVRMDFTSPHTREYIKEVNFDNFFVKRSESEMYCGLI